MSVAALRRVMQLAQQGLDDDLACAFYELLLQTPLHVVVKDGSVTLTQGPGGQSALPVFLDRAALERYAGPEAISSVCSAQHAAQIALGGNDVWLVMDLGSSPGGQPVARAGVEALARGSYPKAEQYADRWEFLRRLSEVIRFGTAPDAALRDAASRVRFFTIGSATGADVGGGVSRVEKLELLTVRDTSGVAFLPAWPTATGTYVFAPEAPSRLGLTFDRLVESALQMRSGLVVNPHASAIALKPSELAAWWKRA
jgi:hypothetical protein